MKKSLISIMFFLVFNVSYSKVFYFSAGFNTQVSLESFFLFNKKTGTVLDKLMSVEFLSILDLYKNKFFNISRSFVYNSFDFSAASKASAVALMKLHFEDPEYFSSRLSGINSSEVTNSLKSIQKLLNLDSHNDIGVKKERLSKLFKEIKSNSLFQILDADGLGVSKVLTPFEKAMTNFIEIEEWLFDGLKEFGINDKKDFLKFHSEISTPGTILNDALRKKLSPLFSTGVQGYFQVGLPIASSDFYYGFELGFGINLGRSILKDVGALKDLSSPVSFGVGMIPRFFVKYDIYYLAATLFTGFGDKSLVADPVYVGNLAGNSKITNPFNVIETGLRFRLAFLNLESSVLFSVSDFKYRDLRVGLGFEVPIIL
ncbi:hypothetical protein BmHG_00554 [Borrelia miyamotoi]|uniref:Uncharacterized protein n=2 Tax=Borrelia miyamotoi TaxID=47466 RepID=A0AAP9CFQ8_9SPIR|nr:hypothetical protein [Borrelia miyamotoi]AHH04869.1 Hypothetical protein BOM_0326 [Borrelia miyamotoi FR64b]AHH05608.1 Hypothetical protein BOM_1065 [Borrelia miyamotoi FR64b]ATQ14693.1 hypothetical protein CNO14_01555 [Borrelia miyamotoi]ATQ15877.1 hypothetical protein CNO13_01560 [Borrelia miyamotoi]ATQ18474.1 hypothetical protein CNO11_02685 [Borrelia miyamotoi]